MTINQSATGNVGASMFFTPNFQFPENSLNQSDMMTDDYLGKSPTGSGLVWVPIIPPIRGYWDQKPLQVGTTDAYKMLYINVSDGLLQASLYGGGIAVNGNKDVLVSIEYYDDNGKHYFNYLTDTDPASAIARKVPTAPENAGYFPVGVIR